MMNYKKESEDVFYTIGHPAKVGVEDINFLKQKAEQSPRRRARICFHPDPTHSLHEMLIVLCNDSYVRPHRHYDRAESLMILEGSARACFFSDDGRVRQVLPLAPVSDGGDFFYRIDQPEYHCLHILSPYLVYMESAQGPFSRAATNFAPWAPDETNASGIAAFMNNLAIL